MNQDFYYFFFKHYLFYFNYTERVLENADVGVCGLRWLRKPENPGKTGTDSTVNYITTPPYAMADTE